MILANPPLSYSRLHTFEECPLQYKLKHLDKVPEPPADPLILGAAGHEFFEAYGKHCLAAKVETDLASYERIAKEVLQNLKRPLPGHLLEGYSEICSKFVEQEILDAATLVGIELDIAFDKNWNKCSFFGKTAAFRGKIDRLYKDEDQATVRDYKTGYGEGNPFQMRIYAACTMQMMPEVQKVNTEFSYVNSGHTAVKEFERRDLPKLVDEIEEKCARVSEEKKFNATPGTACQYCPYASICTAKPSNLLVVTNPEEARQVAEDLFVLEAQVKAKKDALKGYVQGHGDVETASGRWGYSKKEKIKVRDMDAFASLLELKGIKPLAWLSITGTELKKLYKKNDGLKEDVEPLLDISVTEEFKAMKLAKEDVEL
jgi:RecB family exonuclease